MAEKTTGGPTGSGIREELAARKRKRSLLLGAGAGVAAIALVAGVTLAVTGGDDDGDAQAERQSLKLATSEDNAYFDAVAEVAGEKGVDVEWVNLDDWVLPNSEVSNGALDGNAFQHIRFLATYNEQNDDDIVPVFTTVVTRWGLFSPDYDSIEDLPDGATIAIPDDAANSARALGILDSADLITLREGAGGLASLEDIEDNPKDLTFTELQATTIPQQYDDPSLDAVVVGSNYFDPSQEITIDDALIADDPQGDETLQYANVIATTADRADDPVWDVLRESYDDPRVTEAIDEEHFGRVVRLDVEDDRLQDAFETVTEEAASVS
ncbi:MAG TPA: MetQ/NlpA family ABC transporter substrate-binding protein [Brevibacterium senegalense]|uniref:MetQ/NlpA family ABC transporter substrate-binding protein n=1 Tax=Brevibacterium senegalense TaxID=1033736 RepID=A0A921SMN3_9MICO|nr:MetQ/NlpA family ABC transporter substrate-binding protein [Brevibacterium senegalense]